MDKITRHLRITGRVQGVAFRAWMQGEAAARGVSGWVRNEEDGSVTALVHGDRGAVDALITACWSGPGAAGVRDVQAHPAEPPETDGFHIAR